MPADGLLEVGRIGRAHGVKGDVLVHLTTDREERVAIGSRLKAGERWLTVTAASRSNDRWRVHFEGVDDPESVVVEEVDSDGKHRLDVRVGAGDLGRVIGRRGRTAASIRTVTRAAASKDGVELDIEFLD